MEGGGNPYSTYNKVVAIDGKEFLRTNLNSNFRGVVGVAVIFERPIKFYENYGVILSNLKRDFSLFSDLRVLKSYRIMSTLGPNNGPKFMERFYNEVIQYVSKVFVFYTTIPSTKIPEIKKYGADRGGAETISPLEFLKELASSYPHCCAWKYIEKNGVSKNDLLLLDFFQGEFTNAWDGIMNEPSVRVGTDEANPFIATADIITKLIDQRLYDQNSHLYSRNIESCFPDGKLNAIFLDDLYNIVPTRREKIDLKIKLLHPIIFVLKEGIDTSLVGKKREKEIIEGSPAFETIVNLTSQLNGYFKFFDANEDQKLISKGDYFVYMGDNGKKMSEYLLSLGYQINLLSIDTAAKMII